jgi:hypothetical protein
VTSVGRIAGSTWNGAYGLYGKDKKLVQIYISILNKIESKDSIQGDGAIQLWQNNILVIT